MRAQAFVVSLIKEAELGVEARTSGALRMDSPERQRKERLHSVTEQPDSQKQSMHCRHLNPDKQSDAGDSIAFSEALFDKL